MAQADLKLTLWSRKTTILPLLSLLCVGIIDMYHCTSQFCSLSFVYFNDIYLFVCVAVWLCHGVCLCVCDGVWVCVMVCGGCHGVWGGAKVCVCHGVCVSWCVGMWVCVMVCACGGGCLS